MDWHGDDIEEGDITLEPENNEPKGHGNAEHKIEKLKGELEKIKKEKQEYLDGWQRAKADYVNAIKRTEADVAQAKSRGVEKAVEQLLPAFDALERAKEHGEVPEGFAAIAKQLESAFASLGLEAIGEVGEAFDPAKHEAYGQDKVADKAEDDKVTAVLEKGYALGSRIIRPAKVRVGHFQ
ncbi:MAG TPA: nucleotide exchange factor GrpE [Candidatus Paceibacterota bacterium]|nr:nucleotide exchange factor GrpE [Candidatus Paceibacterota bacterium]